LVVRLLDPSNSYVSLQPMLVLQTRLSVCHLYLVCWIGPCVSVVNSLYLFVCQIIMLHYTVANREAQQHHVAQHRHTSWPRTHCQHTWSSYPHFRGRWRRWNTSRMMNRVFGAGNMGFIAKMLKIAKFRLFRSLFDVVCDGGNAKL